jgi:Carbohydrate binding domain
VSSPATNSRPRETAADGQDKVLRWPLDRGTRRLRFLGLGAAAIALFAGCVAADFAAKVLATTLRSERVAQAARLDPLNSAYPHLLGRIAFYERQDLPEALEHYRAATRLNRYSARYWLDLANTQQIMGQADDSRRSLQHALAADPTNPLVAREAANYFLVLGDTPAALKLLALAVRYVPQEARDAIELSWRATQDVHAVMTDVLPANGEADFLFLQVLTDRHQTDAALQAWDGIMARRQSPPLESAFPYIQYLLDEGQVERAHGVWSQIKRREGRGYGDSANLVDNGGFEDDIVNGGFSWRYETAPHVALAIDQRDAYRGRRSLVISFDGDAVGDAGIYQWVAVEPNTNYHLSARVKTADLEGAGAPRLAVLDRYSGQQLFLSDEFTSNGWREIAGNFRTDAATRLVAIRVIRVPGNTRIRGKVWLDELSLERN